jgi:DNA-binding response OmpR family regulator
MVKTGLEMSDYLVDIATNEQSIWSYLEKTKPDVILMDVGMPGIDGISLCRKIRFSPGMENLPIIMVTAFSDERTFHDAMLFGADDFLSKPFEIEEIKRKIENIIAKKKAGNR